MSGLNFPNVGRLNLKNSADGVHFFGSAAFSSAGTYNGLMVWNANTTKTLRVASVALWSSLANLNAIMSREASLTGFVVLQGAENKNLGAVSADVVSYTRNTISVGTQLNGGRGFQLLGVNTPIALPIHLLMPINVPPSSGLHFQLTTVTALFSMLYEAYYDY